MIPLHTNHWVRDGYFVLRSQGLVLFQTHEDVMLTFSGHILFQDLEPVELKNQTN